MKNLINAAAFIRGNTVCVVVLFLLCFILYRRAIFKYKPPGAYIRRGDLTEAFLCYEFEGLTFGGAYTWRGLFSEFYCNLLFRMKGGHLKRLLQFTSS